MTGGGSEDATSGIRFHSLVKCCTYLPELPNYLVGSILRGGMNSALAKVGQASTQERIERRVSVTPLGLGRSAVYQTVSDATDLVSFGRSVALRCPHYVEEQGGACGIWTFRNSVCSTWFCKYTRGTAGAELWRDLRLLLGEVERQLAVWCCQVAGLDSSAVRRLLVSRKLATRVLLSSELDADPPSEEYAGAWGNWKGRETEYFVACADVVEQLAWADVVTIGGATVQEWARLAVESYHNWAAEDIPSVLHVALANGTIDQSGRIRVTKHSPYDPLLVPRAIWDRLGLFEGRSPTEALNEFDPEARALLLEGGLLRALLDYRVLTSASRETVAACCEARQAPTVTSQPLRV
jgi:hypothetical protein